MEIHHITSTSSLDSNRSKSDLTDERLSSLCLPVVATKVKYNCLAGNRFKAFANIKNKCASELRYCLWKDRNIVGKGENTSYKHFLLFLQCFQKISFSGL